MQLIIRIDCDNAAFGDDMTDTGLEVSRILVEYTRDRLIHGQFDTLFRDVNGNQVGRAVMMNGDEVGGTETGGGYY